MNLMALYQDNGQIEMEMNVITFGILKQSTQEQQLIVNGEMHDLYYTTLLIIIIAPIVIGAIYSLKQIKRDKLQDWKPYE